MDTDKTKPTPQPPRRRDSFRYETCRDCGLEWNVSKQKEIPPGEQYICPRCWNKYRSR